MATRQYVGARYVPKFYNYNGSSAWREGTEYEALTIVTLNGNSYTSKIPVPSNVGSPDENTDYWAATGLYNEQVEAYRQLTLMLEDKMEDKISEYSTCTAMKEDTSLKKGMCVFTCGYYTANDYGSAFYIINNTVPNGLYAEELENGLYAILIPESTATPEMFGAVGDGATDDYNAFVTALQYNKHLILNKVYLWDSPIELPAGATIEGGTGTYTYTVNIRTTHGAFTMTSEGGRHIVIKNLYFSARNSDETFYYHTNSSRNFTFENLRIDNYNRGFYIDGTLWGARFSNIRIKSEQNAISFYTKPNSGCFNLSFNQVYFDGGTLDMTSAIATFIGCNFAIYNNVLMIMKGNTIASFIDCNFECETQYVNTSIYPIHLDVGSFAFEDCVFAMMGVQGTYMIRTTSSTFVLRMEGLKTIDKGTNYMTILPTDYLELATPTSLQVDPLWFANLEYTDYGQGYIKYSPLGPACIPKARQADTSGFRRSSLRYNVTNEMVEYSPDGSTFLDVYGSPYDASSNVSHLGNKMAIETGSIQVTDWYFVVNFTESGSGTLLLSPILTSSGDHVHFRIQPDEDQARQAVVRVDMWDATNKVWTQNTRTFTVKWTRIYKRS